VRRNPDLTGQLGSADQAALVEAPAMGWPRWCGWCSMPGSRWTPAARTERPRCSRCGFH